MQLVICRDLNLFASIFNLCRWIARFPYWTTYVSLTWNKNLHAWNRDRVTRGVNYKNAQLVWWSHPKHLHKSEKIELTCYVENREIEKIFKLDSSFVRFLWHIFERRPNRDPILISPNAHPPVPKLEISECSLISVNLYLLLVRCQGIHWRSWVIK
jgi:hypothetical protein